MAFFLGLVLSRSVSLFVCNFFCEFCLNFLLCYFLVDINNNIICCAVLCFRWIFMVKLLHLLLVFKMNETIECFVYGFLCTLNSLVNRKKLCYTFVISGIVCVCNARRFLFVLLCLFCWRIFIALKKWYRMKSKSKNSLFIYLFICISTSYMNN